MAGLGWAGHSAPTLIDLDPQQSKSAAQVSSGVLLTVAAAFMQAEDRPLKLSCACSGGRPRPCCRTPACCTHLLAVPFLATPDFRDTAVSTAMCLWAADIDTPVDVAKQANQYVHANFAPQLSHYPSAICTCLSRPLQKLMVTAVRAVTGDASFHLLCGSDAQSDQPQSTGKSPCSPWGGSMSHPRPPSL